MSAATPPPLPTSAVSLTEAYKRPGGILGRGFCSAAHPTDEFVWCRRMPNHDVHDNLGHAAHVHKISELEYWD